MSPGLVWIRVRAEITLPASVFVCLVGCGRTALDVGDATPPGFIACGDTTCLPNQFCVETCMGDDCLVVPDDAGQCPDGYTEWGDPPFGCCAPTPPPPYCVDDPHNLPAQGCGGGQPDYFELDKHIVACMCPL